ncbi:hypothetical protein ACWIUH_02615 [Ursidibacter arcticus]
MKKAQLKSKSNPKLTPVFAGKALKQRVASCKGCGNNFFFAVSVAL